MVQTLYGFEFSNIHALVSDFSQSTYTCARTHTREWRIFQPQCMVPGQCLYPENP